MWNILIVLIIAIIIFALNPLSSFSPKSSIKGVDSKVKNQVEQVQNEAVQQVDYAREMQKQAQQGLDNQ